MQEVNTTKIAQRVNQPLTLEVLRSVLVNLNKIRVVAEEEYTEFSVCAQEVMRFQKKAASKVTMNDFLNLTELIYTNFSDAEFANLITLNWDEFFNKIKLSNKKELLTALDKVRYKDQNITFKILKACSKLCSTIGMEDVTTSFSSLYTLKHQLKAVVIKSYKHKKDKARVHHCYVSTNTSKLFQLLWQLVIEIDFTSGNVETHLYVTNIIWLKSDLLSSEKDEAIRNNITKYSPPSFSQAIVESMNNQPTRSNFLNLFNNHPKVRYSIFEEQKFDESMEFQFEDDEETQDDLDSELELEFKPLEKTFCSSPNISSPSTPPRTQHHHKDPNAASIDHARSSDLKIGKGRSNVQSKPKLYQTPLLLPGEILQGDFMDDVVLKSDEKSSKKKPKNRFVAGGKKDHSNVFSVNGRLIFTSYRLIFVPEITDEESVNKANMSLTLKFEMLPRKLTQQTSASSTTVTNSMTSTLSPSTLSQSVPVSSMMKHASNANKSSLEQLDILHPSLRTRESSNNTQNNNNNDNGNASLSNDQDEETIIFQILTNPSNSDHHISIPYMMIYAFDKVYQRFGDSKVVGVCCKDFRTVFFSFKNATYSTTDFFDRLKVFFPLCEEHFFAFRFLPRSFRITTTTSLSPNLSSHPQLLNGWDIYNPQAELQRIISEDPQWRIIRQLNYHLCDSYSQLFAVPSSISDADLIKIKEFRSRGRLPALSWRNQRNGSSITRCSQPRVGLLNARCVEDEMLLSAIAAVNQLGVHEDELLELYIMDARPKANAMANHAVGAGVEDLTRYKNTKLRFLNIANIHAMRESLRKLHEICLPNYHKTGNSSWLSNLESSHWLEHINLILRSAVHITKLSNLGYNILIHCSDGWDRTSQLSSVATILLDPFYRTIEGFIVLIEKEWLGFGHKFRDRCGHIFDGEKWEESETSPIFLQFIDCVWQVMQQLPNDFEYNSAFLILLLDHISSGAFGTFLCNTESKRLELKLRESTISLWTFVYLHLNHYVNPNYMGYQEPSYFLHTIKTKCINMTIYPSTSMKIMKFWSEYYLRFDNTIPHFSTTHYNHPHFLYHHSPSLTLNSISSPSSSSQPPPSTVIVTPPVTQSPSISPSSPSSPSSSLPAVVSTPPSPSNEKTNNNNNNNNNNVNNNNNNNVSNNNVQKQAMKSAEDEEAIRVNDELTAMKEYVEKAKAEKLALENEIVQLRQILDAPTMSERSGYELLYQQKLNEKVANQIANLRKKREKPPSPSMNN